MPNQTEASTAQLARQLLERLKEGKELDGQWIVEAWTSDGELYAPEFFATSAEAELAKALMQYLSIHEKEDWAPIARFEVRPAPPGRRIILQV
jgi:hypothetical protein